MPRHAYPKLGDQLVQIGGYLVLGRIHLELLELARLQCQLQHQLGGQEKETGLSSS